MITIVPTRGRHSNGGAQTLTQWPKLLPLTLVVRPEEEKQYMRRLVMLGRSSDDVWILPPDRGLVIGDVRAWITEECVRWNIDKVLMLDDDLRFTCRRPEHETRLHICTLQEYEELVDHVHGALDSYHHVAVSMRDGNNHVPGLRPVRECGRGIRAVGYRLEGFRSGIVRFRPDLLAERTDMDVTLQLLRLGKPNLILFGWAQDHRNAGAAGGMRGQRTQETLTSSAEQMVALHPGLVQLREKTNKTGALAGSRTEVTVRWRRALDQAGGAE